MNKVKKPKFNVFNLITGELAVARKLPEAPYRPFLTYRITVYRDKSISGFTFATTSNSKVVGRHWVRL